MTFDAGTHPDPEALRQAVRDVEFTPTEIRFWVQGTLEPGQGSVVGVGSSPILLSTGSEQRFALALSEDEPGAIESLLQAGDGTVTVWGVTASVDGELTLHVEGHTIDTR